MQPWSILPYFCENFYKIIYLIISRVGTTGLKTLKFIPTSIYLLKVSNGNIRIMYKICSSGQKKYQNDVHVVQVSLWLTLTRFHRLFWWFIIGLSKCRLEYKISKKMFKGECAIGEKGWIVHALIVSPNGFISMCKTVCVKPLGRSFDSSLKLYSAIFLKFIIHLI